MESSQGDRGTTHGLVPVIDALAVDCADPMTVGKFWQGLLGGELHKDRDGDAELHGGPIRLDFVRVPEGKTVKNRLHLDLYVPPDVRQEAIDRAVWLGATIADDVYNGGHWQVMRDVEGNEFCLVWGAGLNERPA